MKVLAIIPARGGSKGIKNKNLVNINGKPLVSYSVEHAKDSQLIDRVMVSSDSEEIMRVAKEYGAEAPFKRPMSLAEDHVLDHPVFDHCLRFLEESEAYQPDLVVHLRPTTPYRKPQWIDEAIGLLLRTPDADSVRSVSEPEKHPYRMFRIAESGMLDPIMKHEHEEPYLLRRQDLPKMYYYNCVIDVTRPTTILDKGSMTGSNILPYIMNPDDVVDIDSPRDLEIVKAIFAKKL